MKVAVIILNYNSYDDCRKCVVFLQRQKDIDLELILVDNNSLDRDRLAVFAQEVDCTFISSKENRGYNAGNNLGLRYAVECGYAYALIANPDMEFPQSDYIAKLVDVMESDHDIVIAGTDIIGSDGRHQSPMYGDGNWTGSFDWIRSFFRKQKSDTYEFIDNYSESHYCAKVSGCCLMVRMDFIKEIGFFDEYPFLYCEEAILARQVEVAGKRIFYTANLQAVHRHIPSKKGDPVKRFRQWKRSRIYFIKYYSDDSWLGKKLACLSINMYICVLSLVLRIKH